MLVLLGQKVLKKTHLACISLGLRNTIVMFKMFIHSFIYQFSHLYNKYAWFFFIGPIDLGFKVFQRGGAWVAQLIECPTFDFGSGHDPRIMGSGAPCCAPCLFRD